MRLFPIRLFLFLSDDVNGKCGQENISCYLLKGSIKCFCKNKIVVLTEGCVELVFGQVLVVVDVVVLQQVKQCALGNVLGQTLLLDDLRREHNGVWSELSDSMVEFLNILLTAYFNCFVDQNIQYCRKTSYSNKYRIN